MEIDLVCIICNGGLTREAEKLSCLACRKSWSVVNGIPILIEGASDDYFGEISLEEMQEVVDYAKNHGWWVALNGFLRDRHPKLVDVSLLSHARADWRILFPITKDSIVLDLGCGWGQLSFLMSKVAGHVVAFEKVRDRLEIVRLRKEEEKINNIQIVGGDITQLPFPKNTFDLIILNGVLEWAGLFNRDKAPGLVQLNILKKCSELLSENGYIYIGIENRISYRYFLGSKDHGGQKYTSLMPRWLASLYLWARNKEANRHELPHRSYRTYTYSHRGYVKLLKRAGFSDISIYAALPHYAEPLTILQTYPQQNKSIFLHYLDNLSTSDSLLRKALRLSARIGIVKYLHHCYLIKAGKGKNDRSYLQDDCGEMV